jgi:hypothetical protein
MAMVSAKRSMAPYGRSVGNQVVAAMSGSIALGDCAARTRVLVIECTRCERKGQYGLDMLISRHGRRCGVPTLLSAYDLCGIHCPGLSELFLRE